MAPTFVELASSAAEVEPASFAAGLKLAASAAGLVFVATAVSVIDGATVSVIGGGCTSTGTRLPGNAEPPLLPSDRSLLFVVVPAQGRVEAQMKTGSTAEHGMPRHVVHQ